MLALRCVRTALVLAGAAVMLCGHEATSSESITQQQELSDRDMNVWGRFGVGSWKRVRIVTETLNEKGRVVDTTLTETKTTLVRADSRQLALKIDATVDVAGKRFDSQPKTIECGYYGESSNQPSEPKSMGTEMVTIEGRQVQCQIRQVVSNNGQQKQLIRLFLSDDVEPFVLEARNDPAKGRRQVAERAENDGRSDRARFALSRAARNQAGGV